MNNITKKKQVSSDVLHDVPSSRTIVHGCNKDVLPLLTLSMTNSVQCIYLDPPYNNGDKYNHYDDNLGHEDWLNEMEATLFLFKPLLKDTGSVWISIDDNEMHYLKVVADRVFGRKNFVTTIVWQQRTTRENRKVFSNNHEYILVYAKNVDAFSKYRNALPPSEEQLARYKNPDNDPRGPWQSVSLNVQDGHATKNQFYTVVAPNGKEHIAPQGRCWSYNKQRMEREIEEGNIWFGVKGDGVPRRKKFLCDSKLSLTPETLWLGEDVGTNKQAKKHIKELFSDKTLFDTPKPESLISRILEIATNEGDLILDPYLGSGTTTAAAHKMNRNYIGIEVGEHAISHAVDRMKMVIDGESGGISKSSSWDGGGCVSYYQLCSNGKSDCFQLLGKYNSSSHS
ncbi:site-specific DNA-methyltransferase [Vibrio lentus]|uniref:site-specific DNA-methyltransferase n=1 Tax=Vibrio lentus TaxID=136468 RepID=UPI000C848061|nr:site-specific DNA-methyltransferase [Vibrio lentus]